jgi:hypothetical protein
MCAAHWQAVRVATSLGSAAAQPAPWAHNLEGLQALRLIGMHFPKLLDASFTTRLQQAFASQLSVGCPPLGCEAPAVPAAFACQVCLGATCAQYAGLLLAGYLPGGSHASSSMGMLCKQLAAAGSGAGCQRGFKDASDRCGCGIGC